MSWVLFAILSGFSRAIVNTLDKYVLTKYVKKPIIPTMVLGIIGLIAAIAIFTLNGFTKLSAINTILAFIAGIIYILAFLFYFKAVKIEEISRVVPLFRLVPLFTMFLAAIFLEEIFTPLKYLGIILTITGAVLISSKSITKISLGKAFWLMILASFLLSSNGVITKYLLSFADFWTIFAYIRIGAIIALIPILYYSLSDLIDVAKKHSSKAIGLLSFGATLNLIATLLMIIAMDLGTATLANALSCVQPFFVLLFTIVLSIFFPKIIKENIDKSTILLKLFAIVLMFVGVVLIV